MNNQFREHYTPAPANPEPCGWLVLAGAACTVSAVYLLIVLAFSL